MFVLNSVSLMCRHSSPDWVSSI